MIRVAQEHVEHNKELSERISYQFTSIEDFHKDNIEKFDAVVLSEVLEHVNSVESFLEMSVRTLKPGGSIFVTTINKTNASWLFAIVAAEYILNIVPRNTHQWEKFISPNEVQRLLEIRKYIYCFIFNFNFCINYF